MRFALFFVLTALAAACSNTSQPVANGNTDDNSSQKSETMIAHSTERKTAPTSTDQAPGHGRWTQSGEPIDTKELDAEIANAEKAYKAKPNDADAKKALGEAYYNRAVALTDARQYASALGDYRRTLKYDPDNAQAKEWIDMIVGIYNDMGRESPAEGKEPPPLPFKNS